MRRTLLGSVVGAGIGILVTCAFGLMTGTFSSHSGNWDGAIVLFIGVFLAGTGAVAGAIVGGVADLLAFFKEREETRQLQDYRRSEPRV
jgi:hypothetical protein